jgi:hypothetical protein
LRVRRRRRSSGWAVLAARQGEEKLVKLEQGRRREADRKLLPVGAAVVWLLVVERASAAAD